MKQRCTDCRVLKDGTPEFYRPILRRKLPTLMARCRCCERAAALARWRRAGAASRAAKLGRPDVVQFRAPELNWSPHCYNLPKEIIAWSRKPLSRSSTQTAE